MSEEKKLFELIGQIGELDEAAMTAAKERQDYLAKPPGSLGRLEVSALKLQALPEKRREMTLPASVSLSCPQIMAL